MKESYFSVIFKKKKKKYLAYRFHKSENLRELSDCNEMSMILNHKVWKMLEFTIIRIKTFNWKLILNFASKLTAIN